MIQSKLHKAIEGCGDDPQKRKFLAQAASRPHFVIDEGLWNIVEQMDGDSRRAMHIQAVADGRLHLPFERMLVEVDAFYNPGDPATRFRLFLLTSEVEDAKEPFFAFAAGHLHGGGFDVEGWTYRMEPKANGTWTVRQFADDKTAALGETALQGRASFLLAVSLVISVGASIRGTVVESVPAPANLNKARIKKGKPPIREFTVMKIGRVYDSSGKEHAYTGRTMPVHLRAGHSRRQHYGKANALTKTIYVPPTIVNFDPNVEVKMPKRILTA